MKSSTPTMVLGIVGAAIGVTLGWFAPYVPLVIGIVGLILLRGRPHDGKRTAGLVLNIINVAFSAVWLVVWLFFIGAATSVSTHLSNYDKCVSQISVSDPNYWAEVNACSSVN